MKYNDNGFKSLKSTSSLHSLQKERKQHKSYFSRNFLQKIKRYHLLKNGRIDTCNQGKCDSLKVFALQKYGS